MATITKRDMVSRISKRLGLPQGDVKQVVQVFLDEVIEALGDGHKLEFRDFGIFHVVTRRARMGRNPRNGQKVFVPAKRAVNFRMGRRMRLRLQEGGAPETPAAPPAAAADSGEASQEPAPPAGPADSAQNDASGGDAPGPGAPQQG